LQRLDSDNDNNKSDQAATATPIVLSFDFICVLTGFATSCISEFCLWFEQQAPAASVSLRVVARADSAAVISWGRNTSNINIPRATAK